MDGNRRTMRESDMPEKAFSNINDDRTAPSGAANGSYNATQRVRIDPNMENRQPAPTRPRETAGQGQRRPQNPQRKPSPAKKTNSNQITVITVCAIAAVLVVAVVVALIMMFTAPQDDGLILNNVYVAGVNLGGKTPEEARALLNEATADTYIELDMVVEVHNTKLTLTPEKTGARLNVDGAVQAAYNYGRTGTRAEQLQAKNQALTSSYVVPLLSYLNLDTTYIQDKVSELGSKFTSTLSQPSHRVEGQKPDLSGITGTPDLKKTYQTLYITLGTPEYGLDTDKLYDQILEAYDNNLFQVSGEISVLTPEAVDIDALYAQYCVAPIDATLDELTYEVTPGVYGYGFVPDDVREQISRAKYGDEIKISLRILRPNITEKELSNGLFEKVIASYTLPPTGDDNLITNLKVAGAMFPKDGLILKVDDEFSFNTLIGALTEAAGYKMAESTPGKMVLGGGVSRLSSALYYCALVSDLQILERHCHSFAPTFIEPGLDADIQYGSKDLRFKNTTGRPIRIEVNVFNEGAVRIDIWGTENDLRKVEVLYETVNTYTPGTVTNVMAKDNPGNYKTGDVLIAPITGYDICTYRVYRYTDADPNAEPVKTLIAVSNYKKQDKVVVKIQTGPNPTQPSDPAED